ncbi:hypothetical protein BDM02DRAFT_3131904 [Thelephora ganbajun]|uniref:Uncharacterized protein n=1 Tax=Thelephora ganbajun TaxID=370292 RepID=A0ACB6Z3H9_THEGA|nr:hypothetical protein BDM02DRAFT_3131904 [Thelephora ganbajun]
MDPFVVTRKSEEEKEAQQKAALAKPMAVGMGRGKKAVKDLAAFFDGEEKQCVFPLSKPPTLPALREGGILYLVTLDFEPLRARSHMCPDVSHLPLGAPRLHAYPCEALAFLSESINRVTITGRYLTYGSDGIGSKEMFRRTQCFPCCAERNYPVNDVDWFQHYLRGREHSDRRL